MKKYDRGVFYKSLAVIMVFGLILVSPISGISSYAYETSLSSTTIEVRNEEDIKNAINSVVSDSSANIKLMNDISCTTGLVIDGKFINFDMGSFTLDITSTTGTGISVTNGSITIDPTASGELNVSGKTSGVYSENSTVIVSNVNSSDGNGIHAIKGSKVTVNGDVSGSDSGILAYDYKTEVIVNGDVRAESFEAFGVMCISYAKANISGNVATEGTASVGVYTYYGEIKVHGDVIGVNVGAITSGDSGSIEVYGNLIANSVNGKGAFISNGDSTITVEKKIIASEENYVVIGSVSKRVEDGVLDPIYPGYMKYSDNGDITGIVLVKCNQDYIEVSSEDELYVALNSIAYGGSATIKLMNNIACNQGIYLDKRNITFDLNGNKLNVNKTDGYGLEVLDCNVLTIGLGEFNVSGSDVGIVAGGSSNENPITVMVNNVTAKAEDGVGVIAYYGCNIIVDGNVLADSVNGTGIECSGGEINVAGFVSGGNLGIYVATYNSTINISGDVVTKDGNGTGIYFNYPKSIGKKNILIIDGKILAAADKYIILDRNTKRKEDGVLDTSKPGYLKYEDYNSTVWVKSEAVCQIGDKLYDNLDTALNEVTNGQTIIMLQNVADTDGIILSEKIFKIDLNGKILNVKNSVDTALLINTNSEVEFIGTGIIDIEAKLSGIHTTLSKLTVSDNIAINIKSTEGIGIETDKSIIDIKQCNILGYIAGIHAVSNNIINIGGVVSTNHPENGYAVHLVGANNTVNVGSAIVDSGIGDGIRIEDGGNVTVGKQFVPGLVNGTRYGVFITGNANKSYVTINGNVESKLSGILIENSICEIKVFGNVKTTSTHPDMFAVSSGLYYPPYSEGNLIEIAGDVEGINGVRVYGESSEIKITGDVKANGTQYYQMGAYASYATLEIGGNVIAENCLGVMSDASGEITIDGVITANKYVKVAGIIKNIDEYDAVTTKEGYRTYSNENSFVWVGESFVCQIGEKKYDNFDKALNEVNDGQTIKILKNITDKDGIIISTGKKFKVDLNEKILIINNPSGIGFIIDSNTTIDFIGTGALTIESTQQGIYAYSAEFKAEEGIIVNIKSINNKGIDARESQIDIKNGNVLGYDYGINADYDNIINVNGEVSSYSSEMSAAVHLLRVNNIVSVDNAIALGLGDGISIEKGGTVTVGKESMPGKVVGNRNGIVTANEGSGSFITVYGNVEGKGADGINAGGYCKIKVYGDVKSTVRDASDAHAIRSNLFDSSKGSSLIEIFGNAEGINGVFVSEESNYVKISGDVTATGTQDYQKAVYAAYGSEIEIGGNVVAENCLGARAYRDGKVTIDGVIKAQKYIQIEDTIKNIDDNDELTTKEGYRTYSKLGSVVWVKNNAIPTCFNITSTGTAGGVITPSGNISVLKNANQTFSITTNSGYKISSVEVDGVNQGAISTYTFTNVTSNHSISATFVYEGSSVPVYTSPGTSKSNLIITIIEPQAPYYDDPIIAKIETDIIKKDSEIIINILDDQTEKAIVMAQDVAKKLDKVQNGIALQFEADIDKSYNDVTFIIKRDALNRLINNSNVKFIALISKNIWISFDKEALKDIAEKSKGDVSVKLSKILKLSNEANLIIGNRPAYSITISFVRDGKNVLIPNITKGIATVKILYSSSEKEENENILAIYSEDDSTVSWIDNSYYDADKKLVIFKTMSFANHGVGYRANESMFFDIKNHWAEADINFVARQKILLGTGNDAFSPDKYMTRGMFVTALGRLAAIDISMYELSGFIDVNKGIYYSPYVGWAVKNGIVSGVGSNRFAPDNNITREEMAVIMLNYANQKGYKIPTSNEPIKFIDEKNISGWAKDAVKIMQQAGVLTGKKDGYFEPDAFATRAEISTVLRRFIELIINKY